MIYPSSRSPPLMFMLLSLLIANNARFGTAFFAPAPSGLARHLPNVLSPSPHRRMQQTSGILRQPTASSSRLDGATEGAPAAAATAAARGGRAGGRLYAGGNGSSSSSSSSSSSNDSSTSSDYDDIDLDMAIANARANLAEGRSPGAGLESAFDQADAAFADLIVTSVDDQGVTLDDQDVVELAKGGMMDDESKSKKSKGLFGDMSDVFGALSGGAHIVKREDGTL